MGEPFSRLPEGLMGANRPVAWRHVVVVDIEYKLHLVDVLGLAVHIVGEVVLQALRPRDRRPCRGSL